MELGSKIYRNRVAALQTRLREEGVHAWILPSADPHQSEYYADYWKTRAWVSGFSGSAGTLVVTQDSAALWTDGRYHLEAQQVLAGTGTELMSEGQSKTPSIGQWLGKVLPHGAVVSYDQRMVAPGFHLRLEQELKIWEITLLPGPDLLQDLWIDRPALPVDPIEVFPLERAGRSAGEKIANLLEQLKKQHCQIMIISALDEVAWTLNLRGKDVKYNPVFYAYLTLDLEGHHYLWINPAKIPQPVADQLTQNGIQVRRYEELVGWIQGQPRDCRFWVNPGQVSMELARALGNERTSWGDLPVTLMKAKKNAVELQSLDDCMVEDGRALAAFFSWLDQKMIHHMNQKPNLRMTGQEGAQNSSAHERGSLDSQGGGDNQGTVQADREAALDELSVSKQLSEFRAQNPGYRGNSFETIVGFAGHGAIIHYGPDEESSSRIEGRGLLLIDSGGQYINGTTDITRTICLGEPTQEEKLMYTLVLQGHIALATARFPQGTTGTQLDILARQALWQRGLNYNHGTGHGVGFCLNVHEGPGRISPLPNSVPLEPGMVFSNEPGFYRPGAYGIRIENLVAVESDPDFEGFLRFRTLTLFPIDTRLLVLSLLSREEIAWINDYHAKTRFALSPGLDYPAHQWLVENTKPIDW